MSAPRGSIALTLGGVAYTLCPSFSALAQLEELSGYGLMTLAKRFADGSFTVRDLAALLKAGLSGAGHIPPTQLEEQIAAAGIAALTPAAISFLESALGGEPPMGKA